MKAAELGNIEFQEYQAFGYLEQYQEDSIKLLRGRIKIGTPYLYLQNSLQMSLNYAVPGAFTDVY